MLRGSYAQLDHPVISQPMTRQVITAQKDNSGLGFGSGGSGKTLIFARGGNGEGFDTFLLIYAASGQGVVIMINANDDFGAVNRMLSVVRREYHWPDGP